MIPDGWNVYKINELSHYITSGSRGWAQYYSDSGDLFVRITNLTRERLSLDLSDSKYVEIPENSNEGKRTRLMVGDILISITADLGIIGFVENEFDKPVYINQHVALLRIDEKEIDNRFIAYQMASESGHQQFISLNDAGAKSGLNLDSIRRFSILIPPLLEQCRIAEMLGVWDESIDLLERLIGRVRSRKQGLMQQLLTGKKRFKEFGLPVISEDSIPDTWRKVTLRETAAKEKYSFTGGPFGSNLKAEHYTEEGVRIIQLQNIGDGHFNDKYKIFTTEEKADELISCNIYPGDIILSKMGDPVARACFIPDSAPRFLMASDGIRLKVNTSEFDPFFLLQ
jgi:type I restriction enzyme, S subunit